jgi:hypothetical protein
MVHSQNKVSWEKGKLKKKRKKGGPIGKVECLVEWTFCFFKMPRHLIMCFVPRVR